MMSCNVHNHRREAFLKAQREADELRTAIEDNLLLLSAPVGLFASTLPRGDAMLDGPPRRPRARRS
jgi:hypothetical protein